MFAVDKKGRKMKSVRNKIAKNTLIITFIIATGMALYGTFRIESLLRNVNQKYIHAMGNEIAFEVNAYMNKHIGYVEGQAKAIEFTPEYSESFMETIMVHMAEGREDVLYTYFNTPKDDGFLVSSDGWKPDSNYSWEHNSWHLEALSINGVYIGSPAVDSVSHQLVAVLRKRIQDSNLETQGVVNMAISLKQLSKIMEQFDLPEGSKAMILYKDGKLVAINDASLIRNDYEHVPTVYDFAPTFELDSKQFEINDKVYTSIPLKVQDWTLWIGVPKRFLLAGSIDTLVGFVLLYMLAGVITLMYVRHYSKRVSDPIVTLTSISSAMAEGDYDVQLSDELLEQNNEISILALTFDDMRKNIHHRTTELQALYEEMAATEETLRENYDELERYKNEVEYYAFNNPLTALPNRKKLLQRMTYHIKNQALANRAILFVTFEEFAHYFQALGQSTIEDVDKLFADKIKSTLSRLDHHAELYDMSPGRYVILTPPLNPSDDTLSVANIHSWLEQLQKQLKTLQIQDTILIRVNITVGAYKIPDTAVVTNDYLYDSDEFIEELLLTYLDYAESAIHSKTLIKWFDDAMYQHKVYENQIENGLHHAIDKEEFYMLYQPKYDSECQMTGVEALIRWDHGKLGLIPPSHFIPIAESAGLIDAIDRFAIQEVIKVQMERKALGLSLLPIAVNLSILELLDPLVVEKLNTIIENAQLPRNCIVIEITETAFSKHLEIAIDNIRKFKISGYEIHLDDFGTGYSSLSYLKNFAVDAIKIDVSFTKQITTHPKVKSIVQSIIELSKNVGAKVVAEGVETQEQFECLKAMGCDYYQGYYFSRPEKEFYHLLDLNTQ